MKKNPSIKKAARSVRFDSARIGGAMDSRALLFSSSLAADRRLAPFDIRASLAHAEMLARCKIIAKSDFAKIKGGLKKIADEIEGGKFVWHADAEDIHLNVERRLIALVGESGKRLHTARSRNDQVATDLRLWMREAVGEMTAAIRTARLALLNLAGRHADSPMPGMTHLQFAQPITFGHHLMAYDAMLARDMARFAECGARANFLPLGSGALAGVGFAIDRQWLARRLGFDGVCENSLDAVSDRDFAAEFCAAASLLMIHLSRFCEEITLWANPAFGFISLGDAFATGSSIMPQKKNPDIAELIRGKCGRVASSWTALMMMMKSQPLAYNRDNQEDKPPLFDAADSALHSIKIFAAMLPSLKINAARMAALAGGGHSTATDLADYLVKKGVAFRDAHAAVAAAVAEAERRNCNLDDLDLPTLRKFSNRIGEDAKESLSVCGSIAARNHIGGTAPARVREAINRARLSLNPPPKRTKKSATE